MTHTLLRKNLFGLPALLLSGALAAGAALAQPAPGAGRPARGIRAAMATLDLTDAQKEKVRTIFASHRDEAQAFRTQAKANRDALKAAASAPNPDPAAVGAAFLKVRADAGSAKSRMTAVKGEIDAVLTPDQRTKLDGWIAAHRQQRGRFSTPAD